MSTELIILIIIIVAVIGIILIIDTIVNGNDDDDDENNEPKYYSKSQDLYYKFKVFGIILKLIIIAFLIVGFIFFTKMYI